MDIEKSIREQIKEGTKIYSLYKNTMLITLFYYQEQQWGTLDNSENNNKINKDKTKKGDNDGRQEQDKQQSTDREKQRRKELKKRAINRIREWMDGGRHDGFISKPYTRTGNNSAQDGLVEYSIEAKPEIKKIFEEAELPTPSFNQLKKNDNKAIDTFKNAIAKAKQSLGGYGASVELKDDYTDINLYLSEDGESGFGIKPNGDIVSVFSNNKAEGGRSAYMLEMAISQGGRQLDCFDVYLVEIYEAHGFKPVAKMKWNDEYIPEGWNKENFKNYNNGEPDVVFMAYDPNNDIEKKKKEAEEKYGKKNEIPYIVDYDMGEDAQHMYKWRSPAEREAIYNNMLERYKNAKSTEELKKVFSNSDKPFLRQMDDLNSLSKEQRQSINAEYSKRYLELIKDENPEEYKKHKKYLEKKYNIKSDASVRLQRADAYIDSLIDIIEYIDAKKKDNIPAGTEWRTLKNGEHILVNSATGEVIKGAGGSLNKNKDKKENDKSKDNDKKGTDDNEGIENSKKYINKCVKSLPKHLQPIGKRLYSGELGGGELVYKSKYTPIGGNFLDQDKLDNLSDTEYSIFAFTEDGRQNSGWEERDNSDIIELIQKSPLKREALFRGEPENNIGELKVGKIINFGNKIRSFTNTEDGKSIAKGFAFKYNTTKEEGAARPIVYQINKPVHALCINPLSYYQSQEDEYLCYGEFKITKVLKKKNFDFIIIEPLE